MDEEKISKDKEEQHKTHKGNFKKAFMTEGLVCILLGFAISFMLCVFAPLDLFLSNSGEFWFGLEEIIIASLCSFAVAMIGFVLVSLLLLAISPSLYKGLQIISFILFLCMYVQGNFLSYNLPAIQAYDVDWNGYREYEIISLITIIVVSFGVMILLRVLKWQSFKLWIKRISLFVVGIMIITLGTGFIMHNSSDSQEADNWITTDQDLLKMSDKENMIVLVLDFVTGETFEQCINSEPDYKRVLDDFTFYKNTMGMYCHTHFSIPYILTGNRYEHQEDFSQYSQYIKDSITNAPILNSAKEAGYQMELYEPYSELPCDYDTVSEFTNIIEGKYFVSSYVDFAIEWGKLIGFKYTPYGIKKYFYSMIEGFDRLKSVNSSSVFSWDDIAFYDKCKDGMVETDSEKQFKFIHLEGAHPPNHLVKMEEGEASYEDMVTSCLVLIDKYISLLKSYDVYDNSVIVIMADHGNNGTLSAANPLLLVKGRNEKHSFEVSDAPISYMDLQDAFLSLLDGNSSTEIFGYKDGDTRERYFLYQSSHVDKESPLVEYSSSGHAYDHDKLTPTGRVYSISPIEDGEYYIYYKNRCMSYDKSTIQMSLDKKNKIKIEKNNGRYSFRNDNGDYLTLNESDGYYTIDFEAQNVDLCQYFYITNFQDGQYRIKYDDIYLGVDYYNGKMIGTPFEGSSSIIFNIVESEIVNPDEGNLLTSEECLKDYANRLHSQIRMNDYLDELIKQKNDVDIYMSVKDLFARELSIESIEKLKQLGVNDADLLLGYNYHSMIACFNNGETITEQVGDDEEISWTSSDKNMSISSGTQKHGCYAKVVIDGIDYAVNSRGLNIVVSDSDTGKIVDSIVFDTFDESNPYGIR